VLEAITAVRGHQRPHARLDLLEQNRIGDHIWWVGDNGRFAEHYPGWKLQYDVERILTEMFEANTGRWS
jgi:CDP-paratose 2-epimerase